MADVMMQILQVAAYYRNDQPGGIAFGISFDARTNPKAGEDFCRELVRKVENLDANGFTAEMAVRDLKALGQFPANRIKRSGYEHAIALVYWLQQKGYLKPDEYNGPVFNLVIEQGGKRSTLAQTERNPVTMTPEEILTHPDSVDVTEIMDAADKGHGIMAPSTIEAVRATVSHHREEGRTVVRRADVPNRRPRGGS